MASALLIASNEICYNPRLLKTADYLLANGFHVTVFNTVVGLAAPELYQEFVHARPWVVVGPDISKHSFGSRVTWLTASAANTLASYAWRKFDVSITFPFVMNRGLILFPPGRRTFDIIAVNLVDNLPFAAGLKRKHGGQLIYDSQELFSGQATDNKSHASWIEEAESRFIGDADVVLATTDAVAERLMEKFHLPRPVIRVRNAPLQKLCIPPEREASPTPLALVWHGFAVNYRGRGIDLLLDALASCRTPATLTLQGRLPDEQRRIITDISRRLGLAARIRFAPPAHPQRIVESLVDYDAGVIAEAGLDENQRLTSSNKLFEYIHAGLCVIGPDLPGIMETVAKERIGPIYRTRDAHELANCIDRLAEDRELLRAYRCRARTIAPEITWQGDFNKAWNALGRPLDASLSKRPAPTISRS